jgi:hypothetical protein
MPSLRYSARGACRRHRPHTSSVPIGPTRAARPMACSPSSKKGRSSLSDPSFKQKPLHDCSGCSQDFTSLALFDRHRVSVYSYSYSEGAQLFPPREDGRRCLDAEEMSASSLSGAALSYGCDDRRPSQTALASDAPGPRSGRRPCVCLVLSSSAGARCAVVSSNATLFPPLEHSAGQPWHRREHAPVCRLSALPRQPAPAARQPYHDRRR